MHLEEGKKEEGKSRPLKDRLIGIEEKKGGGKGVGFRKDRVSRKSEEMESFIRKLREEKRLDLK